MLPEGLKVCSLSKKRLQRKCFAVTPTQAFSREHCEIFKHTYFEEQLPRPASRNINSIFFLKQ